MAKKIILFQVREKVVPESYGYSSSYVMISDKSITSINKKINRIKKFLRKRKIKVYKEIEITIPIDEPVHEDAVMDFGSAGIIFEYDGEKLPAFISKNMEDASDYDY